ncbi:hypothetical protein BDZ89DRAFT_780939 [Hymenopellis radicata]|nr:hypothetical protein BDZ89DRAFT_780939 [Hymenopellis radicata]
MWNRIKQLPGMKSRTQDTVEQSPHPSGSLDVLNSVREQHPNMSVFHPESERSNSPAPPVPSLSPATGSRRFTLKPKKRDDDSLRIRSPSPGPQIGLPKKKSAMSLSGGNNSNEAQRSLSRATAEQAARSRSPEPTRRPSQDLLRPSMDSGRSTPNVFKRPSLDMLRSLESSYNNDNINVLPNPISPTDQFGSVRSILRDPNTPGTGQNVRFFSRDAYKVMTPDQSMDSDQAPPSLPPPPVFHPPPKEVSAPPRAGSLSPIPRSPKSQRPTLNEVFSPIGGVSSDSSMSFSADANNIAPVLPSLPSPDTSNIFDVSQDFQLPSFPPGIAFDLQGPSFNTSMDSPKSDVDDGGFHNNVRTSTPYVNKGKGKERAMDAKENAVPVEANEDIFHRKEKSPRLPLMLHERSQSFSLGQSVFFSMDGNSNRSSTSTANRSSNSSVGHSILSSERGSPIPSDKDSPSPAHSSLRSRSRALSDTVFHSMLSKSASISRSGPPPEADINDESSADLVVYAAKTPEPDPFRANATTYYTPQTMIPVTPPKGLTHVRRASKEEAALFALQNQLAMREELCGQYEADLLAREELVEILGKKLKEAEKEDMRRKGLLRGWKKKVIELEQTCRYLEEQVESSRQESMDRSALDEASGFALTAMQEQIATLHRERSSWQRKEEIPLETRRERTRAPARHPGGSGANGPTQQYEHRLD